MTVTSRSGGSVFTLRQKFPSPSTSPNIVLLPEQFPPLSALFLIYRLPSLPQVSHHELLPSLELLVQTQTSVYLDALELSKGPSLPDRFQRLRLFEEYPPGLSGSRSRVSLPPAPGI